MAHGGTGGAIIELLLVVSVLGIFFAVWLREKRSQRNDEDQIKPQ